MKVTMSGIVFSVYYEVLFFEKWDKYQLNWRYLHPDSHECWHMYNLGSEEHTQKEIMDALHAWRMNEWVEAMGAAIKAYMYAHYVNAPNDTRTEKEKLTDRLKSMVAAV